MQCSDCKGTGKYHGLFAVEECKGCGGSGEKNPCRETVIDLPLIHGFTDGKLVKSASNTLNGYTALIEVFTSGRWLLTVSGPGMVTVKEYIDPSWHIQLDTMIGVTLVDTIDSCVILPALAQGAVLQTLRSL